MQTEPCVSLYIHTQPTKLKVRIFDYLKGDNHTNFSGSGSSQSDADYRHSGRPILSCPSVMVLFNSSSLSVQTMPLNFQTAATNIINQFRACRVPVMETVNIKMVIRFNQ